MPSKQRRSSSWVYAYEANGGVSEVELLHYTNIERVRVGVNYVLHYQWQLALRLKKLCSFGFVNLSIVT